MRVPVAGPPSFMAPTAGHGPVAISRYCRRIVFARRRRRLTRLCIQPPTHHSSATHSAPQSRSAICRCVSPSASLSSASRSSRSPSSPVPAPTEGSGRRARHPRYVQPRGSQAGRRPRGRRSRSEGGPGPSGPAVRSSASACRRRGGGPRASPRLRPRAAPGARRPAAPLRRAPRPAPRRARAEVPHTGLPRPPCPNARRRYR